jgi:hypothetical protein
MYRYMSIDIAHYDTEQEEGATTKPTVEKCLEQFFRPEDREIKCEKCEDGAVATQTMRILSQPKALLLHLKRFVLVEKPRVQSDENTKEIQPSNSTSPGIEMTFRKNKVSLAVSWISSPLARVLELASQHPLPPVEYTGACGIDGTTVAGSIPRRVG